MLQRNETTAIKRRGFLKARLTLLQAVFLASPPLLLSTSLLLSFQLGLHSHHLPSTPPHPAPNAGQVGSAGVRLGTPPQAGTS